jgi:undecaprenyl diphosphate synthase
MSRNLEDKIAQAEKSTEKGGRMTLTLALCYGGRDEIVRAARSLAWPRPRRISERRFADALDTRGLPDPDLIIRTGGDCRLSNFLLWQAAYAELYFTRVLWPDFRPRHLQAALASFQRRERRFGMTNGPNPHSSPTLSKARLK